MIVATSLTFQPRSKMFPDGAVMKCMRSSRTKWSMTLCAAPADHRTGYRQMSSIETTLVLISCYWITEPRQPYSQCQIN